jgi:hypothetical protein
MTINCGWELIPTESAEMGGCGVSGWKKKPGFRKRTADQVRILPCRNRMKLSYRDLPTEPPLWNGETKLIWQLPPPEDAILIPGFISMRCTKIFIQGKTYIIPILPADFRQWRRN